MRMVTVKYKGIWDLEDFIGLLPLQLTKNLAEEDEKKIHATVRTSVDIYPQNSAGVVCACFIFLPSSSYILYCLLCDTEIDLWRSAGTSAGAADGGHQQYY